MPAQTVLVVDDEPLIRMTLADALVDEGFDVLEASNVLEAVAVFGMRHIDFLVTDVDMPGALDGFDLVRFVRVHGRHVVVVVTSGGSVPGEGVHEPDETFIAKPYRLKGVIDKLKAAAMQRRDFGLAM
ncbi:response regulator [Neorhizobium alkalisoli]|uniref:Response regulator receiver domain-containing protein n=1 Tax=Neorhizobium alkalisoli TaxID=528178 RepID=A0A561QCJ7_9HYPH|nr:response regulator [Neorhizobium alkalisoli]TWF48011.1 response regulator receiver domain-containing protein [Neorhizobium alkalisoli]